jgi:glycosidase
LTTAPAPDTRRATFYEQLHRTYQPQEYDNWLVWAGNLSVLVDGIRYSATLARTYVGPQHGPSQARARVELFVAAVDPLEVRPGDVQIRLWTDANEREAAQSGHGRYLPMRLVCDGRGVPLLAGSNLVFESDAIHLDTTGVFNYTAELSADALAYNHPRKEWLAINSIAPNRDGVIVVSPQWVADGPSLVEICARKTGAHVAGADNKAFVSGTLAAMTRQLDTLQADVIYLLPFFKPGFGDVHTDKDVRKGQLGSVYAAADFFRLDPELVENPDTANLATLASEGLLQAADLDDLLDSETRQRLPELEALAALPTAQAQQLLTSQVHTELVGRAHLRRLTRQAHALGKRVIFDLILMQTSRDNPLITQHPEWYVRDAEGRPSIHRIAWLVYSDVALFDLAFNVPLQDYLLGIAPYWIKRCDLDGVRIDASQTVDRPFLKRLKNRINAVRPDALVLGETLCALEEAVDIPVDMVYALMVDFHRDVENADSLTNFLEEMHARFAPRTVALAYFENHDSPRATQVWHDKYAQRLESDSEAAAYWDQQRKALGVNLDQLALLPALLKNLQASLIDASAGSAAGSNLTYGLEWGSDWGEEQRTDFENPTLLDPDQRRLGLRAALFAAYGRLDTLVRQWHEMRQGQVYYQRNSFPEGDAEDRIFSYVRYTEDGALWLLHNFDGAQPRQGRYSFDYLPQPLEQAETLYDTYVAFGLASGAVAAADSTGLHIELAPLQSIVIRLY